jgi:calcineurin-like phosphoesterase
VIGARAELVLQQFTTGLPHRLHPADGDVRIEGVVIDSDEEGRATGCEPLRILVE